MIYTELKAQRGAKYNELFTKCGVFYAFSLDQFAEGKKKNPLVEEGEKYISIGMGGYIRTSQIKALNEGMRAIDAWFSTENKAIKADQKKKEDMILYELNNYECFYTGDVTDAFETLKGEGITKAEILKVYKKNYQLQTANL